ncbi:uncharacterized protein LAJ45_08690 [Morchella importuna]|uniref:uncharacterized protein n=1 Tax=Morchella importuna TaxID=1174673 RepID=UPI001E8E2B80|nr:uncharacterized protein LAJ45_08690 [Morchella importuna]KAH8147212.1 hypothetical protein LAJ45_08690 [Morchella importuna]
MPSRVEPTPTLSYDITVHPLLANDGLLEPQDLAPLRPTPLDTSTDEMRHRFTTDGYLWIKGLLPRADVLTMREKYFTFLSPTGLLKPNTPAVDGIFDAAKTPDMFPGIGAATVKNTYPNPLAKEFVERALQAHTEPWYADDFCQHPKLREFVAGMSGWGEHTVVLRRTLLRNNIPGTTAIGVHYDQIFLRHGEPTAITAWVPIGDIRVKGGGLIYLEGSHELGRELEATFKREADEAGMSEEERKYAFNRNMMDSGLLTDGAKGFARACGKRWLVADYEAGDVVFHNPFMIHAGTVNEDPDNIIRLATDLRYADSSRPWDSRWMKHYTTDDGL